MISDKLDETVSIARSRVGKEGGPTGGCQDTTGHVIVFRILSNLSIRERERRSHLV